MSIQKVAMALVDLRKRPIEYLEKEAGILGSIGKFMLKHPLGSAGAVGVIGGGAYGLNKLRKKGREIAGQNMMQNPQAHGMYLGYNPEYAKRQTGVFM